MQALVEQVEDVPLLVERLEELAQLLDVRQLGEAHQVGFAGDQDVGLALSLAAGEQPVRDGDRVDHHLVHLLARFLELRNQPVANFIELPAAELLVKVGCRAPQLFGRVIPVELQHPVLHLAAVHHQDGEDAVLGQPDELDLGQRGVSLPRDHHHAGEPGDVRKHLRGGRHQGLRVVGVQVEGPLQALHFAFAGRLDLEQGVDEEAVALVRRHPAGGGMRRCDEAVLLEVRHDVADRRGTQLQAGFPGQDPRADRLAVADVVFHQGFQQQLRPLAEMLFAGMAVCTHKLLYKKPFVRLNSAHRTR